MNNLSNQLKFSPRGQRIDTDDRKIRGYNNLKPVYSPGHWKNYISHDLLRKDNQDTLSAKNSIRHNSPSYYINGRNSNQNQYRQQNIRLSGVKYNKKQEHQKRKQDILRRVKMLQDKVLPMVQGDHVQRDQDYDFAWQSRIEQKLVRLQNTVQNLKNQFQITLEKRLLEMENKWEEKFNNLYRSFQVQQ